MKNLEWDIKGEFRSRILCFCEEELTKNYSQKVPGIENLRKVRLWRALFILDIFEGSGEKWENLIFRYQNHPDAMIRSIATKNQIKDFHKIDLYSEFESGLIENLESLEKFERILSQIVPTGISKFCLKNLYFLRNGLENHAENRTENHQKWKIFKHLANTLGKYPEQGHHEEIFQFFFDEFTAGFYRNDFELSRDANGFGIFCKKSSDSGDFSENWIRKSLELFSTSDYDLSLIPLFNSASLPHLFWGLGSSDKNGKMVEKIVIGLLRVSEVCTPNQVKGF